MKATVVELPTLHADQVRFLHLRDDPRGGEWAVNRGGKFRALRAGRRYGKSAFLQTWLGDGALKGWPVGYFAPTYKYVSDFYEQTYEMLEPVLRRRGGHSKTEGILRLRTGGSIEFWTLEDQRAGRSRKYRRAAMDEAAFTKTKVTIETFRQSIKPTLGDLRGSCIVASNTNGVDPDNLMYAVCNDPKLGFIEHHAPAWANPHVPMPLPGQTHAEWLADQKAYYDDLRAREHPLVFAQEYAAEFVDWSGVSFFDRDRLLVDGLFPEAPKRCDGVFAVVDTASKTGKQHDGTGVMFFAHTRHGIRPLYAVDWDLVQIEGALLETWLPTVFQRGEEWARRCGARNGFVGVWIEDANSGTILLQQAARRGWTKAHAVDSALTGVGKDERALSVSGYVWRGEVKFAAGMDKVQDYKGSSRNHAWSQVTSFKLADPDAAKRADEMVDCFCYGISLALGDGSGF